MWDWLWDQKEDGGLKSLKKVIGEGWQSSEEIAMALEQRGCNFYTRREFTEMVACDNIAN